MEQRINGTERAESYPVNRVDRNKEIIFRWTREPVERVEANRSESEGANRLSTWESRNEFERGPEWAQGVTGELCIIRIELWRTPPKRAPSLSPGIEVLIHRKWRVFNRDNTLTMRGIPNAFARPLELSLPLAIVVPSIERGTYNT